MSRITINDIALFLIIFSPETLNGMSVKKICNSKMKNVNRKKSNVGPMLDVTKTFLHQFYQQWNKDLANLLGEDRWLWADAKD